MNEICGTDAKSLRPRDVWREAARKLSERSEDGLIDEPVPTNFDVSEWEWTFSYESGCDRVFV